MKKIVLFFALFLFTLMLAGCDPIGSYYWNITNDTGIDLIVGIEGEVPGAPEKQFVIQSGEIDMVHGDAIIGFRGEDRFDAGQIMCYLAVKINDRPVSNEIWRRSNWKYTHNEGFTATYTLTMTEEFLERLTSKEGYPITTLLGEGVYTGEIAGVPNPPFTDPPLPGIAWGFESGAEEFVLSYDSQWYWGDEDLVIEGVEYFLGDEVEVTGTLSRVQFDAEREYLELKIDTIAKKSN